LSIREENTTPDPREDPKLLVKIAFVMENTLGTPD